MTDENALKQLKRMQIEKDLKADDYNAIATGILALKEKISRETRQKKGENAPKWIIRKEDMICPVCDRSFFKVFPIPTTCPYCFTRMKEWEVKYE